MYGVFLFGSLPLVEAHAPLKARILSPVFLCLLLLALLAADRFLRVRGGIYAAGDADERRWGGLRSSPQVSVDLWASAVCRS